MAQDGDHRSDHRSRNEGNIPRIALSTGSADALECILRSGKLGLEDSEFTPESDAGRVHLYAGANGAAQYVASLNGGVRFTAAKTLPTLSWWDSYENWAKYDIVMLSCEGQQYMNYKSTAAMANLEKYIGSGGRVFASHWHNGWLANARPPQKLQNVAMFGVNSNLGSITAVQKIRSLDSAQRWFSAGSMRRVVCRSTSPSMHPSETNRRGSADRWCSQICT